MSYYALKQQDSIGVDFPRILERLINKLSSITVHAIVMVKNIIDS